jgi:preprotein translocase subunit SecF
MGSRVGSLLAFLVGIAMVVSSIIILFYIKARIEEICAGSQGGGYASCSKVSDILDVYLVLGGVLLGMGVVAGLFIYGGIRGLLQK